MRSLSLPPLHRLRPFAPLLLRVVIGVVMAAHGLQKLTSMGPANFGTAMLAPNGVPGPVLLGWLVTLVELVGGILLVVGLATRISAALLSVVLVGALVLVKVDIGLIAPMNAMLPGAELDLALLAGLGALMLLGPGPASADRATGIEPSEPAAPPSRA